MPPPEPDAELEAELPPLDRSFTHVPGCWTRQKFLERREALETRLKPRRVLAELIARLVVDGWQLIALASQPELTKLTDSWFARSPTSSGTTARYSAT